MARKNADSSTRASRERSNESSSTGRDGSLSSASSEGGRIKRFASAIRGIFQRKSSSAGTSSSSGVDRELPIPSARELSGAGASQGRARRREADIPMDTIANAYTPTQTSLKGGFRDDGRDRSRDQEFARGTDDTRWNDEDHFTNKSNDPRIGTHGRTYEAGETRDEPRE